MCWCNRYRRRKREWISQRFQDSHDLRRITKKKRKREERKEKLKGEEHRMEGLFRTEAVG